MRPLVRARALAIVVLAGLMMRPALGEGLTIAVSRQDIRIASNFVGSDVTVFGVIERDAMTISRPGPYQIAIVLTGPAETVVARRKEQTVGLWVNRAERRFVDVPSFYRLATADLSPAALAPLSTRRKHRIGLDAVLAPTASSDDAGFAEAVIRLKRRSGLYAELPGAVRFLDATLFRGDIDLPANIPVGDYRLHVVLLHDGVQLAETETRIEVAKFGFEQWVYAFALDQSLAYGGAAVVMALAAGWFASVVFRK